MEPIPNNPPLIVILGPTASGKSALALELAQQFNGEIIAADSRTVYKGMDIGTAKPTRAEQQEIGHHLLDVVRPDQAFTVSDFQKQANQAIAGIHGRGKVPFLVGGSGLYIDAVIYNFRFRRPANPEERLKLNRLSVDELQALLQEQNIPLPINYRNPRHLIRSLETRGEAQYRSELRKNTLVIGIDTNREQLLAKISQRVDAMVHNGFVPELKALVQQYGWEAPALQAPGYRAFRDYLAGSITLDEAKQRFVANDMQLAKRQRTWFRRNKDIHWICKKAEAVDLITTLLNK
ncbi:MAG TPA: tRNA (adenosine(37)-N6)-dimethylallyltransferase MiaA [Nevskiaceae bacterium]|nr:tRNA (adenosine(37)-N6)-dimethylallyltransferase MiaA [Nevskiaceae bacterium]